MFLASLAVGTILISAFNSYSATIRNMPEVEQLRNLLEQVVYRGNELLTLTLVTNSSGSLFLNFPLKIGSNQYWMRICNDSTNAWVEGAFGHIGNGFSAEKVYFPSRFSASGFFLSEYGVAKLESYRNGTVVQLRLSFGGGT
jgi:hypothetical protein